MKITARLGYNESILLEHPNGKLYRIIPKTDGKFLAKEAKR